MNVERCRVKVRGKRRCGLRELWPLLDEELRRCRGAIQSGSGISRSR